ncbi:sulfatase [Mariniblastus fucicola]|uniref:Choline-sulfatase n=1 Tax=Mariniblastus fucicola TaxID=980251 RepID=A0A5B9PCV4_9BACT|nr:sulfatase [Mariniblastus fucicola]QEG22900.1 Choline-sulfatase [Mariniblastus fucicola]
MKTINFQFQILKLFILFVSVLLTGNGILFADEPSPTRATTANKKNVLFFHIDDLRPELGCYGKTYIQSPNIDALATQGVLFKRAYCQQALCAPSRISMMSGMYPDTTGICDLWTPITKVMPDAMTMPRYFKQRGYETFSFGKVYHHTRDDKKSWTKLSPKKTIKYANKDTLDGIKQRTEDGKKRGVDINTLRTLGKGPAFEIADVDDEAYPDGQTAYEAIESLRGVKDKLFFMCVGFAKPHLPFAAPKKYWDLYQRDDFDVPDRALPEGSPSLAFTKWGELRNYMGMPDSGHLSDDQTRELKHGYAACVSFADAQVGKVLAELDRLGLRESTIIVLWGDHGYKLGDYGAWCKHTNLELDTHIPFMVSAPGFAKGEQTDSLVEMVDVFPTLAKITGGDVPESCDGKSLEEVLAKPDTKIRDFAISQYPRGKTTGYSLRNARWRYTEWINSTSGNVVARELFDHQSLSLAKRNLADDPQHASLIAELSKQLNTTDRIIALAIEKP